MRPVASAQTLSGRGYDRAGLLDTVRAGLDGSPRAVLVHGEAGIGKTTLVRSVCDEVICDGAQVLWGQSLRFGAVEAMYHPLLLALEGWLSVADDAGRAAVVDAVPGAALILPSLGAAPANGTSMLMMVVDALLSRVIARGPTVLVVDDVQWADPATWDALSYLVAGFARQRMALLTTHRDEAAVNEGFQHWLGNIRRLPATEELGLARLDQDATTDQIALLLGRPPEPRLVGQVFEKSRGNPYFSELLVRRVHQDSTELPDDMPEELSQALLEAWRGLSAPSREIARILAIAGRPAELPVLARVAAELGVSEDWSLREAVDAGVAVLDGSDGVWFRHPLLAAVLVDSYLPGEGASVHAAWAAHLDTFSAEGVEELRRLGDLASHLERAGDSVAAFTALLKGADLAEKLTAPREAADLLVRATALWEVAADATDTIAHAELLERAGKACQWVGRAQESCRLIREARDLVSSERDPLWASSLTRLAVVTRYNLGETMGLTEDERRAVELSGVDPDSSEHAEALAQLAIAVWWEGQTEESHCLIESAVAAAHRSGSASAISQAHGSRAHLRISEGDLGRADLDCTVCWEHALASGEPEDIGAAYSHRLYLLQCQGDVRRLLKQAKDAYAWCAGQGRIAVLPSAMLMLVLLDVGDLREAERVVRAGLAVSGSPSIEVQFRLHAATLTVRRGAKDAARDHLLRARELLPDLEEQPWVEAGPPMAEVLLAGNDPVGAFELVERVLPVNAVDPRVVDELMVSGARAAADLVERASDDRDQTAVQAHREALTQLVKTRGTLPGTPFQPSGQDDTTQVALAALFAAESARAEGVEDQIGLWREAVAACAGAGLGWEQQVSTWRLASSLIDSGARGGEVTTLLRAVHEYAVRQGAVPLQTRVEELAAGARVSLTLPMVPSAATVPTAFTNLTPRELDVLAHLVANRTNAEIAQTLLISDKTVSVHVSNLLRKTQTVSRREVAALARRVGWTTSG
jgi:DNA-binding CsgD family transcriptional regulator